MSDFYDKEFDELIEKGKKINAFYHLICGGRGIGKTTKVNKFLLDEYIKNGTQFCLLCRFGNDLLGRAQSFFPVISNLWFNDYSIQIKNIAEGCFKALNLYKGEEDLGVCGYVICLNLADKVKQFSHLFYNQGKPIIFMLDEFISENNKYCPGELNKLQSIIWSIVRDRDNCIFIGCANAVSVINPLFCAFGIDKLIKPHTKVLTGDGWILQIVKDAPVAQDMKMKNYAIAFKNSDYVDYATCVEFTDNKAFICDFKGKGKHYLTLLKSGKYYTVEFISDIMYIRDGGNKNDKLLIAIDKEEHTEHTLYNRNGFIIDRMRTLYNMGLVRFQSLQAKHTFFDLIRY